MSDMHAVGICGSFALNEIRWPTPNTSIAASSVDRAPTRPARLSSPSSVARIHSRSLSPTSADFRANSLTSIRPLATRVLSESRHAPRAIEYATDTASPCHWARNVALGGAPGSGGAATGTSGATTMGGNSTSGGSANGGVSQGGASTGGVAGIGGNATGGTVAATGGTGVALGGAATGGAATGGVATGGLPGTGGAPPV